MIVEFVATPFWQVRGQAADTLDQGSTFISHACAGMDRIIVRAPPDDDGFQDRDFASVTSCSRCGPPCRR